MEEKTKNEEQLTMFGERDFVYNVLNGQLNSVKAQRKACEKTISKKKSEDKDLEKEEKRITKALKIVGKKEEREEEEVKDAEIVDEEEGESEDPFK